MIIILVLIVSVILSFAIIEQKHKNYLACNIGNTVLFGSFEQDNNSHNGNEGIEWIIVDRENDKVLLLSKKILCARTSKSYKKGWKNSDLRKWLNSNFYKNAFNPLERIGINSTSSICYGTNLNDKVFVLSREEIEKYEKVYEVKTTIPTEYILENFKNNLDFAGENCETWIRNDNDFGMVNGFDEIYLGGYIDGIDSSYIAGVRPAVWVNISSLK